VEVSWLPGRALDRNSATPPWPSPTWLANVTRAARPRGGTMTARRR